MPNHLTGQFASEALKLYPKDVEQAIAAADSFDGFITELQNMGYTVKYGPRVEHMAVRHKDAQRNIRIDRFDPRFSETALREYYHKLHRMPTEKATTVSMTSSHICKKYPAKSPVIPPNCLKLIL